MADETQPPESETDKPEPTPGGDGQPQPGAKPKTLEEALAAIEKMSAALSESNAEAAKRRKALKKFEDEEAKRRQADEEKRKSELTDAEKLKADLAEKDRLLKQQEAEFKSERVRNAVELAAIKLNFHDPADAFKLAELKDVDIEDGKIVGVEEALKKLAKAKPHLVKSEPSTNTNIDAQERSQDKPALTDDEKREMAARLGVDPRFVK